MSSNKIANISSKLSIHSKFMAMIFIAVFISAGAGYYLYKSEAAVSSKTIYYYQNSAGIRHTTGQLSGSVPWDIGAFTSWIAYKSDLNNTYMWYGPYANYSLSSGAVGYKFCFTYYSKQYNVLSAKNSVVFNVTYNNGSGRKTLMERTFDLASASAPVNGKYPTNTNCMLSGSPALMPANINSFELRIKPTVIVNTSSNDTASSIRIISTSISQY